MALRTTSWLSWPSLARTLVSHVRLTLRLLREPGVPLLTKAVPIVAALYVISPLDFVPDFLPVLGQLDDLGMILIALEAFLNVCPAGTVNFHRAALAQGRKYSPMPLAGEIIDAEFRREESRR
ncbi:MAG TPA: YkvA family protein [Vicinamibacterales bacterium]|jgi:uncharacterized membrane protein YkvA (DUF1232 family)